MFVPVGGGKWPGLPAKDLFDPVVANKCLLTLGIIDEDEFQRPFRREDDKGGLVGLFACWDKPHVFRRDPDKGRHVVVVANCNTVSRCVIPSWEDQDSQKGGL